MSKMLLAKAGRQISLALAVTVMSVGISVGTAVAAHKQTTQAAAAAATCSLPTGTAAAPLVDAAKALGFNYTDRSWSVNLVDYNNDGLEDVLIGMHQHNAAHLMQQNSSCTFTWVNQTAWPKKSAQGKQFDRHKCTWGDFDGNGLQDSFCNGGRDDNNLYKSDNGLENELNMQTAAGVFVNKTDEHSANFDVAGECVRGRYTTVADFNGDGWPDLFMGSESPRNVSDPQCTAQYAKDSKLFINNGYGDGQAYGTEDAANWQGFHFDPTWNVMQPNAGQNCAIVWDYDHDGKPDLLACNLGTKAPFLFHNTGTGFVNTATQLKLAAVYGATVGDVNNDGIQDLVFADKTGYAYRLGNATGLSTTTVRLGNAPSGAIGNDVAIGDINGDGLPDIYGVPDIASGTTGNPNDTLFVQTTAAGASNLTFQALTPPATTGRGDCVTAITLANGQVGFLVGNGKLANNGPYQFIIYNPVTSSLKR